MGLCRGCVECFVFADASSDIVCVHFGVLETNSVSGFVCLVPFRRNALLDLDQNPIFTDGVEVGCRSVCGDVDRVFGCVEPWLCRV